MIDFFTKQEKTIIYFLICGLLIGAGVKVFYLKEKFKPNREEYLKKIENQVKKKSQKIDSLLVNSGKIATIGKIKKKSIDLNRADFEKLILLPDVGPVLANRIIEYRKVNGNFKKIEELTKVRGIGEKKLSSILPYLYVSNK